MYPTIKKINAPIFFNYNFFFSSKPWNGVFFLTNLFLLLNFVQIHMYKKFELMYFYYLYIVFYNLIQIVLPVFVFIWPSFFHFLVVCYEINCKQFF